MKTAISLPDSLFAETEAAAKSLGLSRSKLVQLALEEFLKKRKEAQRTAAINRTIEKYGDPAEGEQAWIDQGHQALADLERYE